MHTYNVATLMGDPNQFFSAVFSLYIIVPFPYLKNLNKHFD